MVMKNKLLLIISAIMLLSTFTNAQYYITGHNWPNYIDSGIYCNYPSVYISTNAYTSGLSIKTYYGNGSSNTTAVLNGFGYGYANCNSNYSFPGKYSLKHVLYNGLVAVDSSVQQYEHLYCSTLIIKCFLDSVGSGVFDSLSPKFIVTPLKFAVSKNSVPIDTFTVTTGTYYSMAGALGDVYSFRVISVVPGLTFTYPTGGIIYDTVKAVSNSYKVKYLGLKCASIPPNFDLTVNAVIPVSGLNDQWGNIYINNPSCLSSSVATVTLNFSPKYHFGYSYPAPATVSGNTVVWNLPVLGLNSQPKVYYVLLGNPGIAAGDTTHSYVAVTPTSGDADPSNNSMIIIDTVSASCDPNEMSVTPTGSIHAGTKLKYTINFENTGNDTAFNISVYDTLSDNVDVKSLDIVMASAVMNIAVLNKGGHNIVKFDFPNINLLDSSHHGQCDGAVIFTVNAKNGLPNGPTIFNRAGIYFDYNPVVMTNQVENIIGFPSGVDLLNKSSEVDLYPNPVSNELTIKSNGSFNTLTISNIMGQVVKTEFISGTQAIVNVQLLPSGIYYINLKGEDGVKVCRFIKN